MCYFSFAYSVIELTMITINALGWFWPTIKFSLDIKATRKNGIKVFFLFISRRRELFCLLKSYFFHHLEMKNLDHSRKALGITKYISILLDYMDILKITTFLNNKYMHYHRNRSLEV